MTHSESPLPPMDDAPEGVDGPGVYYICPLDPSHHIKRTEVAVDALFTMPVEGRPGEDPVHALVRTAVTKAAEQDDALILMHFELHHTLKEFAMALGTARNALQGIGEYLTGALTMSPGHRLDLEAIVQRGLGGK